MRTSLPVRLLASVPLPAVLALALGGCAATSSATSTDEAGQTAMLTSMERASSADVTGLAAHFPWQDAGVAGDFSVFMADEIPCAAVTANDDGSTTLDFGDGCEYDGRTYTGVATVTSEGVADGVATLDVAFSGFSDGFATLDGSVVITSSDTVRTFSGTYDATVQPPPDPHGDGGPDGSDSDGGGCHGGDMGPPPPDGTAPPDGSAAPPDGGSRDGDGMGPPPGPISLSVVETATEVPLDGASFDSGVILTEQRAMTGDRGEGSLDAEGLELAPGDAVPQAGTVTVTMPEGDVVTVTFSRVDDATINVAVTGPKGDRSDDVDAKTGLPE